MNPPLRRFTVFAAFAVVSALAPPAHAAERGGSLRTFWTMCWTWLAPLPAAAPAPRLDAIVLTNGVTIDPYGRSSAPLPPGAAAGSTTEVLGNPSG